MGERAGPEAKRQRPRGGVVLEAERVHLSGGNGRPGGGAGGAVLILGDGHRAGAEDDADADEAVHLETVAEHDGAVALVSGLRHAFHRPLQLPVLREQERIPRFRSHVGEAGAGALQLVARDRRIADHAGVRESEIAAAPERLDRARLPLRVRGHQLRDLGRIRRSEVVRFADIGGEIEELRLTGAVVAHEFPVTQPHRALPARRAAGAPEMAALQRRGRCSGQPRQKAVTIGRLSREQRAVRGGDEGGQKIERRDRIRQRAAGERGRDARRPLDGKGHADAALVEPRLALAERPVVRPVGRIETEIVLRAAVVAGETR